jgi:uncharacterized protein DUF3352
MSRRASRYAIPAVLTALAVAAAGCGGAAQSGSGDAFGVGARAIPAHPLAFADVNLDRGSTAWKNVAALGARFPGWAKVSREVQTALAKPSDGVTVSKDVEPYIGDEAAVAVTGLDVSNPRHPVDVLGYAAVTDDGKIQDALTANGKTHATGTYHGLTLFRDSTSPGTFIAEGDGALLVSNDSQTLHASIDAWKGGTSLADDSRFAAAMDALPKDSLVRGYLDARELSGLLSLASLSQLGGAAAGPPPAQLAKLAKTLRDAGSVSAAVGADAHGFRLTVRAQPAPGHTLPPQLAAQNQPPVLIGDVPADAFVYLGAHSDMQKSLMGMDASLRPLEQTTGLNVARDVAPLLTGDVAGYAAPGLPLSAALLLGPDHPEAATAAMKHLTAFLARSQPDLHLRTLPGGRGQVANVGPGMTVGWRRVGDVIAISNDPRAGTPRTPTLASSPAFQAAAEQAGMPHEVNGLVYLNVPGLMHSLPMGPSDPNLGHLGSLLMWGATDAHGATFTAYLQVK